MEQWGRDSAFAEVLFENNLTKMVVLPNEKGKLVAYLLTANKRIFRVRQGGRKRVRLGEVGDDGKFTPETKAGSVEDAASGLRTSSATRHSPPLKPVREMVLSSLFALLVLVCLDCIPP
jgi:hypothetical protein